MSRERNDGRSPEELRPVEFQCNFLHHPLGSVLIRVGNTRVLCSVSDVPGAPRWKREQELPGGWITAEYRMLPGSTAERTRRETAGNGPGGRTYEIQRLIGRSLRAVVDLEKLGDRTLYVDCDVLDADGGTRCAAITGASVALELALRKLFMSGEISTWPLLEHVAAVSVGLVDGRPLLDLAYEEDVAAEVDMNVVMTAGGRFVEVQGTAEESPFTQEQLDEMLDIARRGVSRLIELQRQALESA